MRSRLFVWFTALSCCAFACDEAPDRTPTPEATGPAVSAVESPWPVVSAERSAPAVASSAPPWAPAPAAPTDAARAKRLVEETPLVRRLLANDPALRVVSLPAQNPPPVWHMLQVAPERREPNVVYTELRVKAATGEIQAQTSCEQGGWAPIQRVDLEERALDALFALPELRGFDRYLRKVSGGNVRMTVRLEDCLQDRLGFYVGERQPSHTVRAYTAVITLPDLRISMLDLGGNSLPYASWKQQEQPKRYAEFGLPRERGAGPLGYGEPQKVTVESAFAHPTKAALSGIVELASVEHYDDGFPVFVGTRKQSDDPVRSELERVAKANGYWPFEIVWDAGKRRVRFDGVDYQRNAGAGWSIIPKR